MNSTMLKPGAEGHVVRINWPKSARVTTCRQACVSLQDAEREKTLWINGDTC